jgi:hypothetical protein
MLTKAYPYKRLKKGSYVRRGLESREEEARNGIL